MVPIPLFIKVGSLFSGVNKGTAWQWAQSNPPEVLIPVRESNLGTSPKRVLPFFSWTDKFPLSNFEFPDTIVLKN